MSYLYIDTETDGIGNFHPPSQRLVQCAWIYKNRCNDHLVNDIKEINPSVPHTITIDQCKSDGMNFTDLWTLLSKDINETTCIVAHNLEFDIGILLYELKVRKMSEEYKTFKAKLKVMKTPENLYCTMRESVDLFPKRKFPKLIELYKYYNDNDEPPYKPHDALMDCFILRDCHTKMLH